MPYSGACAGGGGEGKLIRPVGTLPPAGIDQIRHSGRGAYGLLGDQLWVEDEEFVLRYLRDVV